MSRQTFFQFSVVGLKWWKWPVILRHLTVMSCTNLCAGCFFPSYGTLSLTQLWSLWRKHERLLMSSLWNAAFMTDPEIYNRIIQNISIVVMIQSFWLWAPLAWYLKIITTAVCFCFCFFQFWLCTTHDLISKNSNNSCDFLLWLSAVCGLPSKYSRMAVLGFSPYKQTKKCKSK